MTSTQTGSGIGVGGVGFVVESVGCELGSAVRATGVLVAAMQVAANQACGK